MTTKPKTTNSTKVKDDVTSGRRTASLTTIVKRALAGEELQLAKGSTVVVAVSGGPDSMALLSVLARLGPRAGIHVVAHGVDHGLRAEAAAELDLAETFARRVDVAFDRTRVVVPRGGNLQERARVQRWGALVGVARELKRTTGRDVAIATAHHADDRAETWLMRLLRGAGLRGLAVLPARATAAVGGEDDDDAADVVVVRPLLRARRSDVIAHLARHHVPFATDPSNDDLRYLRALVRRRVLPLLEELDPRIVHHIEAVSDELVLAHVRDAGVVRPQNVKPTAPSWAAKLPRSTQDAIATLLRSRSKKTRVWLPDGLVLSVDAHPRISKPQRAPQSKQRKR